MKRHNANSIGDGLRAVQMIAARTNAANKNQKIEVEAKLWLGLEQQVLSAPAPVGAAPRSTAR